MKMSPRIISYDISEGTVFFNTKTNDSFLITNELIKKVDEDEETEKQYESYLEQHNYFWKKMKSINI
ncbi:putative transcriptional regulator [Streptococcus dysgalactiae subsp. equisimilis 167]|nr:putative transcriptional regulator [Streptococcus dysgalactiae subsp. equisimilis 167]